MTTQLPYGILEYGPKAILYVIAFAFLVSNVPDCPMYTLSSIIYNLTLHPLRHFPGPILWRSARLPYLVAMWSGRSHIYIHQHHQKYGKIVRVAPNELSFADPAALEDIYSNRGARPFPKTPIWHAAMPGKPSAIINTLDQEDHARMRRQMEPGFNDRAVAGQEELVQKYVDQLVLRLREKTAEAKNDKTRGVIIDLAQWLTFVSLDIIGDLSFGESFGCLEKSTMDEWMQLLFGSLKAMVIVASLRHYTWVTWVLERLTAGKTKEMLDWHWKLTEDKVNRRLERKTSRADFIALWQMDRKGTTGLTPGEVYANAMIMILAGTETVTTSLSGTFNWLVKCPAQMERLKAELHSTFKNEEEMTFSALRPLPFLNAVLWEGLRMCTAFPSSGYRITPPEGGNVCGRYIAGNTIVSMCYKALHSDEQRFHDPSSFHAERWLPEATSDPTNPFYNDQRTVIQPFSVGSRSCIGKPLALAEARLILARLVWAFEIEKADTPAGDLAWEDQNTYVNVEKRPFEVKLSRTRRS